MSYQVLARKWRPQTWEAVVGQDAIIRTLRNAILSGRVAHAYLFAGPRGIGKTTTARLLAKALRCGARQTAEPCGACEACREDAVDVIEIDGASNRGIEEIRTLRENVKYAPSRGRYKVYIIDEVHQLTEPAFNALLKTLEEPPSHVVFILATTDPRDIPATVLSRVQRFDFRPMGAELLRDTLVRILDEEKITYAPDALPPLVRAAAGSLRDALSLLDTAIAYGDGELEANTTAALLGTTAPVEVRAFAAALLGHDTTAALEAVDRAVREGEDLEAFIRDVIELLRLVLVLKSAPTATLADLSPAEAQEIRALGEAVSLDELLYVMRAFLEADEMMRESPHPRVELEIAAVRATRRPVPQAIEEVLRRVEEAEARLRGAPLAGPAPAAPLQQSILDAAPARGAAASGPGRAPSMSVRAGPGRPGAAGAPGPRSTPPDAGSPTAPRSVPPAGPGSPPVIGAPSAANAPEPGAASPDADATAGGAATSVATEGWPRVLDEVNRKRALLGAVLAQARPGGVVGRALTLVLSGNQFHRDRLMEPANQDILAQALRRWMPGVTSFSVVMEGEVDASPAAHPVVQAAIAEFQGEVVAVRARSPEGDSQ